MLFWSSVFSASFIILLAFRSENLRLFLAQSSHSPCCNRDFMMFRRFPASAAITIPMAPIASICSHSVFVSVLRVSVLLSANSVTSLHSTSIISFIMLLFLSSFSLLRLRATVLQMLQLRQSFHSCGFRGIGRCFLLD